MGLMKYYDPNSKERLPIKSGSIINPDGTNEVTPDTFKAIKDVVDKIPANPKYTDTNTTYSAGTNMSLSGTTFSATDTIYTHPASHPASMITENSSKRFASDTEKSNWNGKMDRSGGTFTGIVKVHPNTSHTVAQSRNIILSTSDAVASQMEEGEIWIKYV